ncbi:MAG: PRC-barrel domain-containing protein [Pseudomonadota bacterium]
MTHRAQDLIGMSIAASDGHIGHVKDVYFDDRRWVVRYLVVDAGDWLMGRKVLISPIAIEEIDWEREAVQVKLTRDEVKHSPDIDTDKPVSRQHEQDFFNYYGYPDYFSGGLLWGTTPYPVFSRDTPTRDLSAMEQNTAADLHLRSLKEVLGYHLQAMDEGIGHLEDFLLDELSWAMRYLVVDTSNWWLGKHVVIPTAWVHKLEWDQKQVYVDVSRNQVKNAPEYDPLITLTRDYEKELFGHYERPGYWH